MRIPKCFTLLTVAMMPLLAGFSQTVDLSTTSPAKAPAILPSSADEVVRLAQSGVGDPVVLAFIGQSHSYYNLSGADITALKNAGVSSEVLTAMLNHDNALRAQEQSSSPVTATVAPQPTVTQPGAVSATAVANQTSTTTVITQSEHTNGAVTLDQWQQLDTSSGPKENFRALDVNGDGQINATEFLTQTPKDSKRYHLFGEPDKTNDGYVSWDTQLFQQPGWQLFSIRF